MKLNSFSIADNDNCTIADTELIYTNNSGDKFQIVKKEGRLK